MRETGRLSNFYIQDSELYWSKTHKITGGVDSIKGAIRTLLSSKPEKRSIEEIDDKSAVLIFDNWHLNNKLDGKGGMSYPQIYNSGAWAFASMITVRDGEYEVKCKNFKYGGVSIGMYYGFGVSSSKEVAGDWQLPFCLLISYPIFPSDLINSRTETLRGNFISSSILL